MKTWMKSLMIYLIFFVGTAAVVHVDRMNAEVCRESPQIIETVENTIEKYASLL